MPISSSGGRPVKPTILVKPPKRWRYRDTLIPVRQTPNTGAWQYPGSLMKWRAAMKTKQTLLKSAVLGCVLSSMPLAQALASDQLALSLGIEPGSATVAELVQLRAAIDDDNMALEQDIRSRISGGPIAAVGASNGSPAASTTQLARSLDVEPGTATLSELAQLQSAIAGDNPTAERHIRAQIGNPATEAQTSPRRGPSAGELQLARSLGVDPDSMTLAELIRLHLD